jgi:hypothetical protein
MVALDRLRNACKVNNFFHACSLSCNYLLHQRKCVLYINSLGYFSATVIGNILQRSGTEKAPQTLRLDGPRGSRCPPKYWILKFVVHSFGLDSFSLAKGNILNRVVRSGNNFANNYSGAPDRLSTPLGEHCRPVFPNLVSVEEPLRIVRILRNTCLWNIVAYRDYSSPAKCRTKFPRYFEGYLTFFAVYTIFYLFIYSFIHSTISCGTSKDVMLIGKHWFRDLTVVISQKPLHCPLLLSFDYKHSWHLSTDFSKTTYIIFHRSTFNDSSVVICGRTDRHGEVNVYILFKLSSERGK